MKKKIFDSGRVKKLKEKIKWMKTKIFDSGRVKKMKEKENEWKKIISLEDNERKN